MSLRIVWSRRSLWLGLIAFSLFALLLRALAPLPPPRLPSSAPLAGFSYSPKVAKWMGFDPGAALRVLVSRVHPDLVRIPVYWDSAAPTRDQLDFGETDRMLDVLAQYDRTSPDHHVGVVLVVGARNLGAPELYLPQWLS